MNLSRRDFLGGLGVLSLGIEVGCGGARTSMIKHAAATGDFSPSVFLAVKRDGRIAVQIDKVEFGQGVTTLYSTLVAEDLDVPIEAVDAHLADSLPEYRTITGAMHLTGGSASARNAYLPVRRAAASAREMLIAAAAEEWGVAKDECRTEMGMVVHPSGRKLGYGALTVKAARQPLPDSPRLKARAEMKLIGKTNRRVDARAKIDGTAVFGMDVVVPNMVRAHVIHGPTYGANAVAIRGAERARVMPGVLDVFAFPGGVAIVAEKYWQALAVVGCLDITWDAGVVAGLDTDKLRATVRAHKRAGDVVTSKGNANKAIERAAIKVEATYEGPYLAHAPMEPQNCVVHIHDGKAEVWAPNQAPTIMQAAVAEVAGIGLEDVLVHTTLAGGGFGRRAAPDFVTQAAHIALVVKRPVQMTWSRESDMTQGFYRPFVNARVRGAVTADGKVAMDVHAIGQTIAAGLVKYGKGSLSGVPQALQGIVLDSVAGLLGTDTVTDPSATEGIADTSYALEDFEVSLTPIQTKLPVLFWRSVGHSFNGFVMESFVDELAHAAKIDPLELRRRTLPPDSRPRRVLDAVAAMAGWGGPKKPGIGRGLARHTSFESEVAEVAEVEIVDGRIKVRRVWVAVDCGIVVNPDIVRAQMEGGVVFGLSAALDQEITLKGGVVQQTNFDHYPPVRMFECPEITVQILQNEERPTGVGEPGLPPIAPAVANAIFDLTGVRLRQLPLQRAWNEARK